MKLHWNLCEFKFGKTVGFRIWFSRKLKTYTRYYEFKFSIKFHGPYINSFPEKLLSRIVNIDGL